MYKRLFPLCLVGVALLLGAATTALADVIRIDDLAESLAITTDSGGGLSNVVINGESATFDFTSSEASIGTSTHFGDLLEADGTTSDRYIASVTLGSPVLHFIFGSDLNLPALPPPGPTVHMDPSVPETGDWQTVVQNFNGHNPPLDTYLVRSDVREQSSVPEPGSLALLTGLLAPGAALLTRRRKSSR